MRRNSSDLLLIMLIAAVNLVLGLPAFDWVPIRVILAIPMVLVVPGYALVSALFPKPTVTFAEQTLLSSCGSIAIAILGGFGLYWTPWGLQSISWAVLLSSITYVATVVALLRRNKQATFFARRKRTAISVKQVLLMAVACLIFSAAVAIARTPVSALDVSGYSQLWMLPSHTQGTIRLGLRSEEFTDVQYRLELKIDNAVVKTWPSIDLKSGQEWETTTNLAREQLEGKDVEALLYRLDKPDSIYRRVVLRGDS